MVLGTQGLPSVRPCLEVLNFPFGLWCLWALERPLFLAHRGFPLDQGIQEILFLLFCPCVRHCQIHLGRPLPSPHGAPGSRFLHLVLDFQTHPFFPGARSCHVLREYLGALRFPEFLGCLVHQSGLEDQWGQVGPVRLWSPARPQSLAGPDRPWCP